MNTSYHDKKIQDGLASLSNPAAEQVVMGSMLMQPALIEEVNLNATDFSDPYLRHVFTALKAEGAVDYITLADDLARASFGKSSPDKMLDFIYGLCDMAVGGDTFNSTVGIVAERSLDRRLMGASSEMKNIIQSTMGLDQKLATIAEIYASVSAGTTGSVKKARSIHEAALDYVKSVGDGKGNKMGVSTGYDELDKIVTSMMGGDLIVVGGRPGMGKTAFALGLAENVADNGGRVGIFSMEMPDVQLAMRMLSGKSGVGSKELRSGILGDNELSRLNAAAKDMKSMPIVIDDSSNLTPKELRMRAKEMMRNGGITLLIVDYMQLMQKSDSKLSSRDAVTEFSGTLKSIAKELGIPVIALAQLSRDVEKRVDKRPVPSDLRDSGSIEQDADAIWFVYRDEVYHRDTLSPGVAEVIVGKNRSGPQGTARLGFTGSETKFVNLPSSSY